MGLLEGKRAVIFGVANDRSIAWAISEAFHAEGAELAFTYAGEVLEKRVRPLAEGIGAKIILPCDVTKDEEIEKVFATLKQEWGSLDILIHAIAFANKEDLANPYVQTSRQGFHLAMDVSAYSFVALARHAAPLMEGRKASIRAEEVGKPTLFLCSDWGWAVTGEVMNVDAGYNIVGM